MAFIFEELVVYQEAVNLAEQISKLTEEFPRGSYYLSDQINRAATSIALNIAEGNGRYHKNDRNRFFYPQRRRPGMNAQTGVNADNSEACAENFSPQHLAFPG